MLSVPLFLLLVVFFLTVLAENMTEKELGAHELLAGDFIKGNQKAIRGSSDERWIYKFMNVNSIIPPDSSGSSSASGALSDSSSADLVVLSDTVGTAPCATGWTRYDGTGNCYQQSASTYSWYEAEAWCWSQRAGAHLASVHSQAEAVWLNAQYKVWYLPMDDWIGLRRACDNVTYYWTDGSAVDFVWWQPSYPQSAYAEESCTTIWDTVLLHLITGYVPGQFDDMKDCGEGGSSALCKYDPNTADIGEPYSPQVCTTPGASVVTTTEVTTTTITATVPDTTTTVSTTPLTLSSIIPTTTSITPFNASLCTVSPSCPENWVQYGSKCYLLINGTATYSEAVSGCESQGGTLVEIGSSDENEALRKAFSNDLEPTSTSITSQAWIANSTYSNYASGAPSQGADYCNVFAISPVESLGYSRGVWTDEPCSSTQQYAICSKALIIINVEVSIG